MITFFLTFVTTSKTSVLKTSIIGNFISIEINLSIFSGWFWTFFIMKLFLFIPPSCLLDFRKNSDTSFIMDKRVRGLTTFIFFTCLVCIYLLLVSKTSALRALRVYCLCHFYLPYINLVPSGIFRFSNKEDKQILRLRLIITDNVWTFYGITKNLPANDCFFFFLE